MGRNAAQNVMDCLKRLDKQGRPYPLQAYKNCKSWADKRKFAQQLMLDKSASFLSVEEDKEMTRRQETQKAAGWCYLWDVARLNGISFDPSNEKQMQMLKTFVAGCETKPSPDALVADQGWLLYYYSKEFESQEKFVKGRRMKIKAEAPLDEKDHTETGAALDKAGASIFELGLPEPTQHKKAKRGEKGESQAKRQSFSKAPNMPTQDDDVSTIQTFIKESLLVLNNLILEMKSRYAFLCCSKIKEQVWWNQKLLDDVEAKSAELGEWQSELCKMEVAILTKASVECVKEALANLVHKKFHTELEMAIDFNKRLKHLAETVF